MSTRYARLIILGGLLIFLSVGQLVASADSQLMTQYKCQDLTGQPAEITPDTAGYKVLIPLKADKGSDLGQPKQYKLDELTPSGWERVTPEPDWQPITTDLATVFAVDAFSEASPYPSYTPGFLECTLDSFLSLKLLTLNGTATDVAHVPVDSDPSCLNTQLGEGRLRDCFARHVQEALDGKSSLYHNQGLDYDRLLSPSISKDRPTLFVILRWQSTPLAEDSLKTLRDKGLVVVLDISSYPRSSIAGLYGLPMPNALEAAGWPWTCVDHTYFKDRLRPHLGLLQPALKASLDNLREWKALSFTSHQLLRPAYFQPAQPGSKVQTWGVRYRLERTDSSRNRPGCTLQLDAFLDERYVPAPGPSTRSPLEYLIFPLVLIALVPVAWFGLVPFVAVLVHELRSGANGKDGTAED